MNKFHTKEQLDNHYADISKYVILNQRTSKELREKEHIKQNNICPILKQEFNQSDMTLDHKHKLKNNPVGPNGDGLCRGVIHRQANSLEGKITNAYKRLGLDSDKFNITLPEFLRNLADYLENPPLDQIYVHPNEKLKIPKMNKMDYNKIKKYWKFIHPNKKLPKCPKNLNNDMVEYLKEVEEYEKKLENGEIKKINKIEFKRILKYYNIIYPRRKKLPEYPEYGIMNSELEELLNKVNEIHFNV